jgi:CRP/FNR family transcriptional regulator, dissimilatory nitrate respiration regulator
MPWGAPSRARGFGMKKTQRQRTKGIGMTDQLKINPLFSGLDEEGLLRIKEIASRREIKKGESLFIQGEEAEGFFLVLQGRIKIYRLSPQGKEYILRIVGPGETLAEAAVFSGKTYPASADSLEDSRLYYLKKSDFVHLIRQNPQLALNMISGLSLLLRNLAQQVEDLSLHEVSCRLARYLLEQAVKNGFPLVNGVQIPLEIKKNLLASRLGTIGETLSRTLAKMKQRGLLEIKKDAFIIQDLALLKEVAEGAKL